MKHLTHFRYQLGKSPADRIKQNRAVFNGALLTLTFTEISVAELNTKIRNVKFKKEFLQHALSCYVYNRSFFGVFTKSEVRQHGTKPGRTHHRERERRGV